MHILFIKFFSIDNIIVYIGLMIDSSERSVPKVIIFILTSDIECNCNSKKVKKLLHNNIVKHSVEKDDILEKINYMKTFFKTNQQSMTIYKKISIL
jgi:hypothetical protein